LADLRTRLDALVTHLKDAGVAAEAYAPLTALLADLPTDLPDETGHDAEPAELWDRAIRVLTEFSGDRPASRRAFWKKPG
jgi:hypothetical protein